MLGRSKCCSILESRLWQGHHVPESKSPARKPTLDAQLPQSTKNRQKITWHSRIHTGEKPYRCHLCSYTCADPSRLKYHMRIHKEERKYLCPECGYKCNYKAKQKFQVVKHVRRHHPDQADPSQGVGKDPTTPTVHLHDVKLEDPSPPAPPAPPTGPEGWTPTPPLA
ncbi:hypothetical protein ACRRTK_002114 [Alexandromys fortis]